MHDTLYLEHFTYNAVPYDRPLLKELISLNLNFLWDSYLSKLNSYNKYFSFLRNFIPKVILENPIGFSIFPVGMFFLLRKLLFFYGIPIIF